MRAAGNRPTFFISAYKGRGGFGGGTQIPTEASGLHPDGSGRRLEKAPSVPAISGYTVETNWNRNSVAAADTAADSNRNFAAAPNNPAV